MSAEQAIHDARRVDAFLNDPAIGGALSRMERRYYEEFKSADSSEKRVTAWAKAHNLDDFLAELRIVISTGEREVLAAAKAARPTPKES